MDDSGLLDEAHRLLDDHGEFASGSGVILRSERVVVIVHPAEGGGALVVSIRSPGMAAMFSNVAVVVPSTGASVRLNRRGLAVVPTPGTEPSRLGLAKVAGPPATVVSRRLTAAAATQRHQLHQTLSNAAGDLTTDLVETAEAHLVLTVSAEQPCALFPLVSLGWALSGRSFAARQVTLVSPLAEVRGRLEARYDVGSVEGAESIGVSPAEWAAVGELAVADVDVAFQLEQFGVSRTAWAELAAERAVAPEVRERIAAHLART